MTEKSELGAGQSLIFSVLAVVALCAVVLTANAVSNLPVTQVNSFPTLDTNLDGFIGQNEAASSPSLIKVFELADQNGDGRLSPDEYAKAFSVRP